MTDLIRVYIFDIRSAASLDKAYCTEHFPRRYERAERFKFEADKLRCIAAGWLLSEILQINEAEILIGECGKPYAPEKPEFNLSHSGNFSVLAVSDDIIGVDVERIDPKHLSVADRVFTARELSWLSEIPEKRFGTLWTLKEAASKAVGRGLSLEYKSFCVLPIINGGSITLDGKTLYGYTSFIEDCALSVVSAEKTENIKTEYVEL